LHRRKTLTRNKQTSIKQEKLLYEKWEVDRRNNGRSYKPLLVVRRLRAEQQRAESAAAGMK
jgi:hypothetical protein